MVERARIVLAAAEGRSGARIASELGCSEPTVKKWRRRYESDGPRIGGRVVPFDKRVLFELFVPAGDEGGAASGDMVSAEITRGRTRARQWVISKSRSTT